MEFDLKLIINASELQLGKEKAFGIWGEKKREFKLSIRWNEKDRVYECYKLYFDTNEKEILYRNEQLVDIVIKTCNIANNYAKNLL